MRSRIFDYIKRYGILCIGLLIYAVAFNLFMLPNNFVVGGTSGISILLYEFFKIDSSLSVSVLSTLLLIIGFFFVNRDRMYSSVASTFILPIFIKLTSGINNYVVIETSMLLSALYCSILVGVSLGLVYKVGFSTGGTDILYWIVEKYIKKSIGTIMILVEGIIVLVGAFVFGFQMLMYALIILYIMSKISDRIIIGIAESKLICIIPYKYDEVNNYLKRLGYVKYMRLISDNGKDVIYSVVPTNNYQEVYDGIRKIDKKAFISVNNTYETKGGLAYE